MEDKRIQDEEFTEEELDTLSKLQYTDEEKYNKIMNQIKNNESFEKISEGLRFHEPEHESSRHMR